ncbi:MAG TPA: zf-HC2 domain-containing protein [Oligoflexia bacterium]|nr:zf-HC2 domain-containing protein [Oligoflexia bacterium]HMP49100.1 zf-HC2 domain-containing protein [Oligoflexia bacterium]
MGQLVEFKARRGMSASKSYRDYQWLPFIQEVNGSGHYCEGAAAFNWRERLERDNMGNSKLSCEQSENRIIELLDGELDQVTGMRVVKHVSECPECQRIMEEHQHLKEISSSLNSGFNKESNSGEVKKRLRSRLVNELGLSSSFLVD